MAKDLSGLRDAAAAAVERGKLPRAIELYGELEQAEPSNPAWPKRIGETHRRNGDNVAAVHAFERAADKYTRTGFLVQAIAVCKLILQIDPKHSAAISKLAGLVTPAAKPEPARTEEPPAGPSITLRAPSESGIPARSGRAPSESGIPEAAPPPRASARPPSEPGVPDRSERPRSGIAPAWSAPPSEQASPGDARTPRAGTQAGHDRAPAPRPPSPGAASPPSVPRIPPPPPRAATQAGHDRAPAVPPRPPIPPAPSRRPSITLPPGGGLDALDLASIVPGSRTITRTDGSSSGLSVVPIEEPLLELLELAPEAPAARPLDASARLALLNTPLFAGLPRGVLEQLIARMGLVELAPGQVLFREGDVGGCLYVISEGTVTVESAGRELAELGPSSFFGEIALVTDLPRSATIRAVGAVELLSIDRDVVRDAAAQQPDVINVLLRFVRDRLVDRMTRTSPLFQPFAAAERQDLARRFELLEVVEGVSMIAQGERADGLYVLIAGRAEVWRDDQPEAISVLGSGDVFGEMSLLNGGPSIANVRSASRVLALRMPVSTFREVIMTHPQVLAYLGELADQRSPHPEEDVELIGLHLDLL